MAKRKTATISQEMLNKIIPPINNIEDEIKLAKKCDEEYEKNKQIILEIMKKNMEKYENQ